MRSEKGFTLIELLIVVVIIGILASIAIPKFANTKEKSYIAAMKSDLRNLATAEESYLFDSLTYTPSLLKMNFFTTTGVTITVSTATAGGWAATATHGLTTKKCYMFYGNASPIGTATKEGQINCS